MLLIAVIAVVALVVVTAIVLAAMRVSSSVQESKFASKEVATLFGQLRGALEDFRRSADAAQKENAGLGRELRVQLEEVGRKATGLGRQADEFVAALRGGNKLQGNWGEGILTKTLEDAGLVKDVNYKAQSGSRDTGLPDVRVFDGDGHEIVIDSKVNIDDFIAAVNASRDGDAETADRLMKAHAKSVRAQVAGLSAKKYAALVIMFMPSEATYAAALAADPTLAAYANGLGVVLASPQMLFGYLVLFKMGLDRIQVDRNNAEIAKRAQQVIDRLDAAFVALDKVGKALEDATARYHDALAKLGGESGAQNLVTPARDLIRLTNSAAKRNSKFLNA